MITLKVTGLTCGHCARTVTEELSALPGVHDVKVDLNPGEHETSTVQVCTNADISDSALKDAIAEAGYVLENIER